MGESMPRLRWSDGHARFLHVLVPVLVVVVVHAAGRISAICASANYDSLTYAVAAYRFYSPGATAADLVPDKPAGQFLLTGWCYWLWPGAPSRLVLAPVESAFLFLGYGLFWHLARRLYDARVAAVQIVLMVFAFTAFNVLDDSAAGFDVQENYLLPTTLLAVTAHLTMPDGRRRGLVRGLGLGLALSIKQTAVGLLVALLIHGVWRAVRSGGWRDAFLSAGWTAAGVVLAACPLVVVLAVRGWLVPHLQDLISLSGGHLQMPRFASPPWVRVAPLAPIAWWILAGLVGGRRGGSAGVLLYSARGHGGESGRGAGAFLGLWMLGEVGVLAFLNRHSAHYYQPLAVPASLLAGAGVAWVVWISRFLPESERARLLRWSFMITFALAIPALMTFVIEARRRWLSYDLTQEAEAFAQRLANGGS